MSPPKTGQAALAAAIATLNDAGVDDAARDARRLLAHALDVDAGRITLILPEPIGIAQADAFDRMIAERCRRVPVSHLTGQRAFFGRTFEVGPDVLDPRPDTETLVAEALKRPFLRVLDLGTGSGCIVITLLAETGVETFGIGTDVSPAALAVAGRNAARLGVSDRVQFQSGDWFAALPDGADFDLIVSNPPYIAADEMPGLAPEVRDFEPRVALTDEGDGLGAYRIIVRDAQAHLVQGGRLMVEIGPTQGGAVAEFMQTAGFGAVQVIPDIDGRDRVVTGEKPRS